MSNIKDKAAKENVNSSSNYRKIILSNIRHDLANPINAILGYSELIMDVIKEANSHKNLLENILAIHASGIDILEHINTLS